MFEKDNMTFKLFLMEDNSDDVILTKLALEKSKIHFSLEVVNNGQDAVKKLIGKTNILPDLILLDINLPRMNGIEVLSSIKSELVLNKIPIVMFTSSDSPFDMKHCYENGASLYLKKPNDINGFMDAIKNIVNH